MKDAKNLVSLHFGQHTLILLSRDMPYRCCDGTGVPYGMWRYIRIVAITVVCYVFGVNLCAPHMKNMM